MTAHQFLSARPVRLLGAAAVGAGLIGALAGCSAGGTTDSAGSGSGGTSAAPADYTDGTYVGSGDYQTPDSAKVSIDVKLTLASNKVTDISVVPNATSGNAKEYQDKFAGGIADQAVGKRLEDLAGVTRVAGSSLTHLGFAKAITQIETLAAKK